MSGDKGQKISDPGCLGRVTQVDKPRLRLLFDQRIMFAVNAKAARHIASKYRIGQVFKARIVKLMRAHLTA